MKVSFVIIGKNEANNILRCIKSIKKICNDIEHEIIYVDSNSDDGTEEILKNEKYKNIIKYRIESNIYSAALARYVGAKKATGEFLFFIDADMEIQDSTDILFCLACLNDNKVGIVSGELNEVWIKNGMIVKKINKMFNVKSNDDDLISPGGYFITKKSLYEEIGGFSIDLKCNEEVDLFSRYKKKGKRLIRTKKLLCLHYNEKDSDNKSHYTRFKSMYYVDFWRAIIKSIKGKYFMEYLGFRAQQKMLRSIMLTIIMMICLLLSTVRVLFLIIPILYYFILGMKYIRNIKLLLFNQLNNFFIFLSIIYVLKKVNVRYSIHRF